MPKGIIFTSDILKLFFQATGIALLADNAAATPLTNLYVALHTADPSAGDTQTTNEIAYTGYARMPVARTTAGWTLSGQSVTLAASVTFPAMTAGAGGLASFWSAGTALTGAGKMIYSAPINPPISVVNGVAPELTPAGARVPPIVF